MEVLGKAAGDTVDDGDSPAAAEIVGIEGSTVAANDGPGHWLTAWLQNIYMVDMLAL